MPSDWSILSITGLWLVNTEHYRPLIGLRQQQSTLSRMLVVSHPPLDRDDSCPSWDGGHWHWLAAEEGLLHHPTRFKVSLISQMVQSKTQSWLCAGAAWWCLTYAFSFGAKIFSVLPLSLFPARPILMSVYAGCVISSSQSEASIAAIDQWEAGICWLLFTVIIYPLTLW